MFRLLLLLMLPGSIAYSQDLILKSDIFFFADTTFNVSGDILIEHATVTFVRCTVNVVLQYDQEHFVEIAGDSRVTIDSSLVQGVGYQTDIQIRARDGMNPSVIVKNGSLCTNHAGFGFFDKSTCEVSRANIEEVQAHDNTWISIREGSAYLVLFFPQGDYSVSNLYAGDHVTLSTGIAGGWQVDVENGTIAGYQFDLYKGTTLTASDCEAVVLSIHTPGDLPAKVELSDVTGESVLRTGSVTGLGPVFQYADTEIFLVNLYASGRDTIECTNMTLNEIEAHDSARVRIGKKGTTTESYCNLLQSDGSSEIRFSFTTLLTDADGEPSGLCSDGSRIRIEDSDVSNLQLVGQGEGRIEVVRCRYFDSTRVKLLDDASIYVSSFGGYERRLDGAIRVTNSSGTVSCQNPVFSPDGKYILYTRFLKGYNGLPSELVRIATDGSGEKTVIPAGGTEESNVNVPYGSWIGNIITWASDRAGYAEELYTANDDGTGIRQCTDHDEAIGAYIEPVFNPVDPRMIVFEFEPPDSSAHHIFLYTEVPGARVISLMNDPKYDDRLPSWSGDGRQILWQRNEVGKIENWEILVADISLHPVPGLSNLRNLSNRPTQETDNSWAYMDRYVLSSSDYHESGNTSVPNIWAFPSGGGPPYRVTSSTDEDGAPSYAPPGNWIAFESHRNEGPDENEPSEIWIIEAPRLPVTEIDRPPVTGHKRPSLLLQRNAPNPFDAVTTISWQQGTRGDVTVMIYNIFGQRVGEYQLHDLPEGEHGVVFEPKMENGVPFVSSIYLYSVTMQSETRVGTMMRLH